MMVLHQFTILFSVTAMLTNLTSSVKTWAWPKMVGLATRQMSSSIKV